MAQHLWLAVYYLRILQFFYSQPFPSERLIQSAGMNQKALIC